MLQCTQCRMPSGSLKSFIFHWTKMLIPCEHQNAKEKKEREKKKESGLLIKLQLWLEIKGQKNFFVWECVTVALIRREKKHQAVELHQTGA